MPPIVNYSPRLPAYQQIAALMAAFFEAQRCTSIRALAPGYADPGVIRGNVQDWEPLLICVRKQSLVICEALFFPGRVYPPGEARSRLQLFWSAREVSKGELHVVLPRRAGGRASVELAEPLFRAAGVHPTKVWVVGET